jgi:hypothetical protein
MSIKKNFEEVVNFLQANQDKQVKVLMSQILELVESKKKVSTTKVDENGKITHVFCYYHKKWEDVSKVEYGSKASSHTGINTMCKVGVNQWTKQQSDYKKAKNGILDKVSKGEIKVEEIESILTALEIEKNRIVLLGQEKKKEAKK